MSLPGLSDDGIACICSYLSGNDVLHLISSGCRVLGEKLRRNCLKIEVELKPFQSLPTGVYMLPRLESVSLSLEECYAGYPIRLLNRPFEVMEPMNWVTKLKLGFAQSFSVLSGTSLRDHVPNLRKLLLTGSTIPLTLQHLSNIPQQLKTLELSRRSAKPSDLSVSISAPALLRSLPYHLESFKCRYLHLVPSYQSERMVFPPQLRKLVVGHLAPIGIVHSLPSRIEHVEISPEPVRAPLRIPISTLPQTLKHFQVDSWDENFEFLLDGPMPPNIEHWEGNLILPPDQDLSSLIPLLGTKLKQLDSLSNAIPLPFYTLPSLTTLTIHHDHLEGDFQDAIQSLPSQLQQLIVYPDVPASFVRLLPASITELDISITSADHMMLISSQLRGLRKLEASCGPVRRQGFSYAIWRALPQSVTDLAVPIALFESASCLRALPVGLKKLILSVYDSPAEQFSTLISELSRCGHDEISIPSKVSKGFNGDGMPNLDPGSDESNFSRPNLCQLQTLCFRDRRGGTSWIDWARDLTSFSKLEHLFIFGGSTVDKQVDADLISRLPRTLRTLLMSVPFDGFTPSVELFYNLPPHLTSLDLAVHRDTDVELTDEHFARLPHSLAVLSLGLVGGLSERIFDVIPKGIRQIDLAQVPTNNSKRLAYFAAPHWETFVPNTSTSRNAETISPGTTLTLKVHSQI